MSKIISTKKSNQSKRWILFAISILLLVGITSIFANADSYPTDLASMRARAEAMVNYQWTPKQDIYTWNGNSYNGSTVFKAGTTVTGMPYTLFTSEVVSDSLLSLKQFKNVTSSNYSSTAYCVSVPGTRTGPVYGSCCATFVSEIFGGSFMNGDNPVYDSCRICYSPNVTSKIGTVSEIQPGDAVINTSGTHIIWIGDITETTMTVYEQTPPVARKRIISKPSGSSYLIYDGATYNEIVRSNEIIVNAANSSSIIDQLKAKFPHGKYWNHVGMSVNNEDGYTSTPCSSHSSTYTCNAYTHNGKEIGWQCFGFACKLGYDAYGTNPKSWDRAYNLDNIKPGDIINYNGNNPGHTVFVIGVDGDTITFAECNWGARCIIKWGRSLKKSQFYNLYSVYVAPYALDGVTNTPSAPAYEINTNYPTPFQAHTRYGKTYEVYSSVNGSKTGGYIDSGDICTIKEVYRNGWLKVTYPVSGGTRTAFSPISEFFDSSYSNITTKTVTTNSTAYRRSDLAQTRGTAEKGDACIVIGESGSYYGVICPWSNPSVASSGKLFVWVSKDAFSSSGSELDYHECSNCITTNEGASVVNVSTVLNVRDGPGISYTKLFEMNNGTSLIVSVKCNGWYYVTDVNANSGWVLAEYVRLNSEDTHTHYYSWNYEALHPHKEYMKCSCGDYYYINENYFDENHFLEYEAAHPHKKYNVCGVCLYDYTEYTGETQYIDSCTTCNPPHIHNYTTCHDESHPHRDYKNCSCGDLYYLNSYYFDFSCAECTAPEKPVISVSKTNWYENETVTFSWQECERASYYYPMVYDSAGNRIAVCWGTSERSFSANLAVGTYYLQVASVNDSTGKTVYSGQVEINIKEKYYTISFNATGGSYAYESIQKRYQVDATLPDNIPNRNGYKFKGWSTSLNGSVEYEPNASYCTDSDLVLYAVWNPFGYCGKNLTWELFKDGELIISGTGTMDDFYDSTPSPWLTHSQNIKKVIIQNGATNIGNSAFDDYDSLTSITIPNSVTGIGHNAFKDCDSLTNVIFGSGSKLISIGSDAFFSCDSLKSVTFGSKLGGIGASAFAHCYSLTSITIPASVTSIRSQAFYNCFGLTSVTFESGGKSTNIGSQAFDGCKNLTSITIPDGVTSIASSTFYNCDSLTVIEVDENNPNYCDIDGFLFSKDKTKLICCPVGTKLTEFIIPDSVTSIEVYAFDGCKNLTSITIPDSVTSIESGAFRDCTSLKSVTFESGSKLTSIRDYAFARCYSLTSITIPDSVTSIESGAFRDCTSLEEITLPFVGKSATATGYEGVFGYIWGYSWNHSSSGMTYQSYGNGGAYYYIPASLKKVTITGGTNIGSYVFYNCENLTSITIPDSVTSIGNQAFYNCKNLTSITIPDSVTSIGNQAFYNCKSLTSITIPHSVKSIGNQAFRDCTSLKNISIPHSVEYIGYSALGYYYSDDYKKIDGFTIHGEAGTAAEDYAKKEGFTFSEIELASIKGTSLILDGSIGVKTYLDIAQGCTSILEVETVVSNTKNNTVIFKGTLIPEYDREKELYYIVVYITPKDANNAVISNTFICCDSKTESDAISVLKHIEDFKERAKTDEGYAKGLGVVEALEAYVKYADNFFGDGTALKDVTTDTNAIEAIANPTKTGTLSGINHISTSLVLEEKTTIRHYFEVTDDEEYVFSCCGEILESVELGEGIIYVDIADIPAHNLDEVYTLTVNDTVNINYSALNYVKSAAFSEDAKTSNLAKAIYNYWYEANEYAK